METTEQQTKPARAPKLLRTAGGVLACLPPALLILFGLRACLFGSARFNICSCILFFLAPGLVLTRLIFMLRKERPAVSAVLRVLGLWVLLALVVFSSMFWTIFFPMETHAVVRVNPAERFAEHWPKTLAAPDPGQPREIACHECFRLSGMLLDTESTVLLCAYGDDYEAEKAALETRFSFREEPLTSWDRDADTEREFNPTVRIGDDEFRFLNLPEGYSGVTFYKYCVLIVTNDVTREIGYLIYEDIDVDYAPDIERFIEYNCCWSFVR